MTTYYLSHVFSRSTECDYCDITFTEAYLKGADCIRPARPGTLRSISEASGVSTTTIRTIAYELRELLSVDGGLT